MLIQQGHPVAFYSKVLGSRNRLRSIYEKELMAIVFAVQKWRHFLLGRKFVICTDQQSLKFLMEQREIGTEYQRWISKLMGYDFEICYRPGRTNVVADALSRKTGGEMELGALVSSYTVNWEDVQRQIKADRGIQQICEAIEKGQHCPSGYTLAQGVLRYKGRVVIPASSTLVQKLLSEYHDSPVGGHSGEFKTYQRLAQEWFWCGMRKAVSKYVQSCQTCQQQKVSSLSPAGLLQPLPIPNRVWEDISLDFVEGLPKSKGFDTILVVVDRLTKYGHFIGLKHPFTAPSVAQIFVKEIVRLHGYPVTIVSDRDKIFMSLFWREIFRIQGSALHRSSAYHPQSDGQTEVVNKTLESYLRCFIQGKPKSWADWLHWAEYWYNTSFHVSAKCSPFQAVYGREPPI